MAELNFSALDVENPRSRRARTPRLTVREHTPVSSPMAGRVMGMQAVPPPALASYQETRKERRRLSLSRDR